MKDKLAKFVSKIETESDYVLWLSLDKNLLQSDEQCILGVVYIPPENSIFYNDDDMMQYEYEVTSFCSSSPYIMLTGDFNSRTLMQADYIQTDEFLSNFFFFFFFFFFF